MKYLFNDEKIIFDFKSFRFACYNYHAYSFYQINGLLSFAVIDLAFKIIKQQKRKVIVFKKRKPIIHLLNYVDILNSYFKSKIFRTFSLSKNDHIESLIFNLYLYRSSHRRRYYEDFYKDDLKVTDRKNLCIIELDYGPTSRIQPKNSSLVSMLMRILDKKEITIDGNGIVFYCVFLM